LGEGIINERRFAAIEETHKMLDKHKREYQTAVKRGVNEWEIETLRDMHRRELKEAVAREADVGAEGAQVNPSRKS
jgi:hypothetical protein